MCSILKENCHLQLQYGVLCFLQGMQFGQATLYWPLTMITLSFGCLVILHNKNK